MAKGNDIYHYDLCIEHRSRQVVYRLGYHCQPLRKMTLISCEERSRPEQWQGACPSY
ncbi:MAG: hypothetical protein RLZZ54_715 [Cyanobacteriota bacterium]|jgi:hypothetical protein